MKTINTDICISLRAKIFSSLVVVLGLSCTDPIPDDVNRVLDLAGTKGKELQSVLDYYQAPKDSLKLEAAYFLIGNMDTKYVLDQSENRGLKNIYAGFDSIYKASDHTIKNARAYWLAQDILKGGNGFEKSWDSLRNIYQPYHTQERKIIKDMDIVTSSYLIQNIDLSFEVWQDKPWAKHLNFDQFCEFLLPYKMNGLPFEPWRAYFKNNSLWLDTLLDQNPDPIIASRAIQDSLQWIHFSTIFQQYPSQSLKDILLVKAGKCKDMVNLASMSSRACGVPVATGFEPHFTSFNICLAKNGAYLTFEGTSEIFADPEKSYVDDPRSPRRKPAKLMMNSFRNINYPFHKLPLTEIPELFRNTNIIDMTRHLTAFSADLNIALPKNIPETCDFVFLYTFIDRKKTWKGVHWTKISEKDSLVFHDMGKEKVYLAGYQPKGVFTPLTAPFYFDLEGNSQTFIANKDKKSKQRLYRTRGLSSLRVKNAKRMLDSKIEVSNKPDFSESVTIHVINDIATSLVERRTAKGTKYRYVRYKTEESVNMAEFKVFDQHLEQLSNVVIISSPNLLNSPKVSNIFDDNEKTFLKIPTQSWVGLDLGEQVEIGKVECLPAHYIHTIQSGKRYELFYWDDKWVSLGVKQATSHYLDFKIPDHALLLLKGLDTQKVEMVFFMKNGNQHWG